MVSSVLLAVCGPTLFVVQNYVLRHISWRKQLNNTWIAISLSNCTYSTAVESRFFRNFVRCYSSIHLNKFFNILKLSSLATIRAMPGRWRLFFYFWKYLPNRRIFFGRENCSHTWGKLSAATFFCVHHVWAQNLIPACCFPLAHCSNEATVRKEPFSLIARNALMSTISAGVSKLRLTILPTAFPKTTLVEN